VRFADRNDLFRSAEESATLTVVAAAQTRVARAFTVLEAFTPSSPALTLSEISRRARLPLTTTHRLVADLIAAGALERDGEGRYRIGLRLWEIGSLAPRGVPLREAALPFLEDLYEVTHENAQLGVREGHDVVYIERIAGRRAVGVLTRVGGRFPLHASGIGVVLLAHAPERIRREVLDGPLQRFTQYTVTDPARLERILAQVRRDGVAIGHRREWRGHRGAVGRGQGGGHGRSPAGPGRPGRGARNLPDIVRAPSVGSIKTCIQFCNLSILCGAAATRAAPEPARRS
jgi:DNA-binding IclR family transcriptional regulator